MVSAAERARLTIADPRDQPIEAAPRCAVTMLEHGGGGFIPRGPGRRDERRHEAGALREPGAVPARQRTEADLGARVGGRRRNAGCQGSARTAEAVPQREHAQVAGGADRVAVAYAGPGLGGVLDQDQPALVAPPSPASGVLEDAQVVNEVERSHALVQ